MWAVYSEKRKTETWANMKIHGEYLLSQVLVWMARVVWSATWQDMRAPAQWWAASWKPPASAILRTTTPWAGKRQKVFGWMDCNWYFNLSWMLHSDFLYLLKCKEWIMNYGRLTRVENRIIASLLSLLVATPLKFCWQSVSPLTFYILLTLSLIGSAVQQNRAQLLGFLNATVDAGNSALHVWRG